MVLVFLLSLAAVNSQEGAELMEVPEGSVSKVTSTLDARIENVGYDRVFVALPSGWEVDTAESSVRSYAVREYGLWRIYSSPIEGKDLLEEGHVYDIFDYQQTRFTTKLGEQYGWWVRPNEGLKMSLELTLPSSGEVDPKKIQEQHPEILVREWNQDFELEISSTGIIEAPWTVEGGTLTTASPAPLGDARKVSTSDMYYVESYREEFEESEEDIPDWYEWLPLKNSMAYEFRPSYKLESFGELSTPGELDYVKPVWKVDTFGDIRYGYEWKQGREIEGIRLVRDDYSGLPAWYEWF